MLVGANIGVSATVEADSDGGSPVVWRERTPDSEVRVHLYFFWTETCPHCRVARPEVQELADRYPWLVVHEHEVGSDRDSAALYVDVAEALGEQPRHVPAFAYCGSLVQGYPGRAALERDLLTCHRSRVIAVEEPATRVTLPFVGATSLQNWSLPLTTVVLAALDAFNPCAFFVLLFLLSLLVRTRSRARMAIVSGIFVFFSGLWYFLFMAAWLNLFLWVEQLRWITIAAGVVAIGMGLFNVKDFVARGRGPSLSIPASAKPSLFRRMRALLKTASLPSLVTATVVLAAAANSYELLCTAGFPLVYARILTLNDLSTTGYYLYLGLYNLVYILPLLVIAGIFIKTLGSRKLQEHEGRALELLSGLMMLGLGSVLLISPEALASIVTAVSLLLGSGVLTMVAVRVRRRRRPNP